MHLTPSDDPMSIFVAGKLKPGRYKVQNLASQTYLEVLEPSKELCCRPASVLSPKDALWDFQPSGSGYKIKKVDEGKPEQFCNALGGFALFGFGGIVSVAAFPASWRVEIVEDIQHRGFGYVRIFWGSTNRALDLSWWGSSNDGTKVALWEQIASDLWRMWKLIPIQDETPPPYSAESPNAVSLSLFRIAPRWRRLFRIFASKRKLNVKATS